MQAETSTTSTWLFIDGLPDSVTADELKKRFASFSTVCGARLLQKSRRQSRSSAYVLMATHQEAQILAEVLTSSQFRGKAIHVMLVERGERQDPAKKNVDCSCKPSTLLGTETMGMDVCKLCGSSPAIAGTTPWSRASLPR